jgi:hypothetical protein
MVFNAGLTKPGEVGDFFALVSMKSPNFCQKAKFQSFQVSIFFTNNHTSSSIFTQRNHPARPLGSQDHISEKVCIRNKKSYIQYVPSKDRPINLMRLPVHTRIFIGKLFVFARYVMYWQWKGKRVTMFYKMFFKIFFFSEH